MMQQKSVFSKNSFLLVKTRFAEYFYGNKNLLMLVEFGSKVYNRIFIFDFPPRFVCLFSKFFKRKCQKLEETL